MEKKSARETSQYHISLLITKKKNKLDRLNPQLTMHNFTNPQQTKTFLDQKETEKLIQACYDKDQIITFNKQAHIEFLNKGLKKLSFGYSSLDSSRPWICYWVFHSLSLLQVEISIDIKEASIKFLSTCQNLSGGFGGGPYQLSHLATTFAAINAFAVIGQGFELIDRQALYSFLIQMKQPNGSFRMHEGGEVDVRGSFCAISVAINCNILTDELLEKVPEFISSCQTFEGGVGSLPGNEAHGGYTYCAVAALKMINRLDLININQLILWTVNRQQDLEGGFNGRTNKLVDGCYSFWIGSLFHMLDSGSLLDKEALKEYSMCCCQSEKGGLRDKPGKSPDFYHTCYVLSGLSMIDDNFPRIDPMHNVLEESLKQMQEYFSQQ